MTVRRERTLGIQLMVSLVLAGLALPATQVGALSASSYALDEARTQIASDQAAPVVDAGGLSQPADPILSYWFDDASTTEALMGADVSAAAQSGGQVRELLLGPSDSAGDAGDPLGSSSQMAEVRTSSGSSSDLNLAWVQNGSIRRCAMPYSGSQTGGCSPVAQKAVNTSPVVAMAMSAYGTNAMLAWLQGPPGSYLPYFAYSAGNTPMQLDYAVTAQAGIAAAGAVVAWPNGGVVEILDTSSCTSNSCPQPAALQGIGGPVWDLALAPISGQPSSGASAVLQAAWLANPSGAGNSWTLDVAQISDASGPWAVVGSPVQLDPAPAGGPAPSPSPSPAASPSPSPSPATSPSPSPPLPTPSASLPVSPPSPSPTASPTVVPSPTVPVQVTPSPLPSPSTTTLPSAAPPGTSTTAARTAPRTGSSSQASGSAGMGGRVRLSKSPVGASFDVAYTHTDAQGAPHLSFVDVGGTAGPVSIPLRSATATGRLDLDGTTLVWDENDASASQPNFRSFSADLTQAAPQALAIGNQAPVWATRSGEVMSGTQMALFDNVGESTRGVTEVQWVPDVTASSPREQLVVPNRAASSLPSTQFCDSVNAPQAQGPKGPLSLADSTLAYGFDSGAEQAACYVSLPAAGGAVPAPVLLDSADSSTGDSVSVPVAADEAGAPVVVWARRSGSNVLIRAQTLSGGASPYTVHAFTGVAPAFAVLRLSVSPGMVFALIRSVQSGQIVYWIYAVPLGGGVGQLVHETSGAVACTAIASDGVWIGWIERAVNADGTFGAGHVYVTPFQPGNPIGPIQVSSAPAPGVDSLALVDQYLTWTELHGSPGLRQAAEVNLAQGVAQGFTVESSAAVAAQEPAIGAGGPGGQDLTVWEDEDAGATDTVNGGGTRIDLASLSYNGYATPIVTAVTPSSAGANAEVRVTGTGFTGVNAVTMGKMVLDADHMYVSSGPSGVAIYVNAPAPDPGTPFPTLDVRVATPGGTSQVSSSDRFTYGPSGYLTDAYGHLYAFGVAPSETPSETFGHFDIARGVALVPDVPGWGYVLDGYGAVHEFGGAPPIGRAGLSDYWGDPRNGGDPNAPFLDIARAIALNPTSLYGCVTGYVLDGYGGVHPFHDPVHCVAYPQNVHLSDYWGCYCNGADQTAPQDWDIAKGIVAIATPGDPREGAGYVLDGYGGVHAFWPDGVSEPPVIPPGEGLSDYWGCVCNGGDPSAQNLNIARAIALNPVQAGCLSGFVLDGYGGIHPFKDPTGPCPSQFPSVQESDYWGCYCNGADPNAPQDWDIARGVTLVQGEPGEGYYLDVFGGVHTFSSGDLPMPAALPPSEIQGYPLPGAIARGIA